MVSDADRKRLMTRNGIVPGTLLVDGFVAGTQSGGQAAIDVPDEVKQTVRSRLESDKRMVFRISIDSVREVGAS